MHKVSAKRQVTLPKRLCLNAGINPGDLVEIFEHEGRVTVMKQQKGASSGSLQHLRGDKNITDEESLQDGMDAGNTGPASRR